MIKQKKILVIIQRSNGDVFLSLSLIKAIYNFYNAPQIDLLVNDDTYQVANLLPYINLIHTFSYNQKASMQWTQEKKLFVRLFRKYDLSINLTSSDRSVIYAVLAGRKAISVIEKNHRKSWWKKMLLTDFYYFDNNKHILIQNLTPLSLLNIKYEYLQSSIVVSNEVLNRVQKKLINKGIKDFIIFHPSAQYQYKVFPKNLRDQLLLSLSKLGITIIVTGGKNELDQYIKAEIPSLNNIINYIGKTTLIEYFALSKLSMAYIGMDTLNMHIAASQNKRIFAIFGPTKLAVWSPWSNKLKKSTSLNKPVQTYGNNTIFQSYLPCKTCGLVGCGNIHGKDEFTFLIKPNEIFNEIKNWYQNVKF